MQHTHCTGCLQSHNRQTKSYSGCVNLGNSKMLSDFWSEHWQLKSGSLGLVPSDSSLFIFLYCTTYYSWGIPFKLLWLRAESQNLLAKYSVGLYSRSRHRYFIKVLQANVPNVLTFKKVMYSDFILTLFWRSGWAPAANIFSTTWRWPHNEAHIKAEKPFWSGKYQTEQVGHQHLYRSAMW